MEFRRVIATLTTAALIFIVSTIVVWPVIAGSRPINVHIAAISKSVLSSKINAAVKRVIAREGRAYKKGTVLVEMDCRAHKARQAGAKAAEKFAALLVDNLQRLTEMKSASTLELAEAENSFAQRHQENVLAGLNVEHCTVIAPFDGGVVTVATGIGEYLEIGDPILEIVAAGRFEAQLLVPSSGANMFRVGQKIQALIHETNARVNIRIDRLGRIIDPVSRTTKIYGTLIKPPANLKSGMTGKVITK